MNIAKQNRNGFFSPKIGLFLSLVLSVFFAVSEAKSQEQELLFDGQTGGALLSSLRNAYSTSGMLDYGIARDTMFLRVWRKNGRLEGQYTGFDIPLPDGVDPTEYAFDRNINTEHLYPRSKGAGSGNALADMHHLYPTRVDVNSDRSSLPFADIPDNQTIKWYRDGQQQQSPPSSNRDEWSEWNGASFEPRESMKGDIARAVFYFYTMYQGQANAEDPQFFLQQRQTLCAWNEQDPIDAEEYERNERIEHYQGNLNPFILDCTLPDRVGYCPDRTAACQTLDQIELGHVEQQFEVFPNPASSWVKLSATNPSSSYALYNARGHLVTTWTADAIQSNGFSVELPARTSTGIYLILETATGAFRRLVVE